jgi:hypothetical protein
MVALFSRMNTAPDRPGSIELFGPGIRVEFNVEGGLSATKPTDIVASIRMEVMEGELFDLLFLGTRFETPGKLASTIRQSGWTLLNTETGHCYPQSRDDDDDDDAEEDEEDDGEANDRA